LLKKVGKSKPILKYLLGGTPKEKSLREKNGRAVIKGKKKRRKKGVGVDGKPYCTILTS